MAAYRLLRRSGRRILLLAALPTALQQTLALLQQVAAIAAYRRMTAPA